MTDTLLHSSFYRFVPLTDPSAVVSTLRERSAGVLGSIIVAAEGLSGVVAGTPAAVEAFEQMLLHDPVFGGALAGLSFKRSRCVTPPFARLAVHLKPELVAYGQPGVSGAPDAATHLSPAQWRELLARDDVVLIDNRNSFEFRLGHFRGAVDPGVDNFRDFAAWLHEQMPHWQAQGRTVAMYCTGGIRCEKIGPWLRERGLPLLQLDGGILNYLQSLPDAEREWQGECFVFDNRIALDARLQETATTAEQVYDPARPDEAWRLERARRLDDSVAARD